MTKLNINSYLTLTLFFLLILNQSCDKVINENYILEGDAEYGYVLVLNKTNTTGFHIFGDNNKIYKKGVRVKYHNKTAISENIDTVFLWKGCPVISAHIEELKVDSSFALIDQKPLDSIWGIYDDGHRPNKMLRPNDSDNQINKSNFHCYWIIQTKTDDVFGPFTKSEYLNKRNALKIPKKLKLSFED